jgi:hypothetical protein
MFVGISICGLTESVTFVDIWMCDVDTCNMNISWCNSAIVVCMQVGNIMFFIYSWFLLKIFAVNLKKNEDLFSNDHM